MSPIWKEYRQLFMYGPQGLFPSISSSFPKVSKKRDNKALMDLKGSFPSLSLSFE